MQVKYASLKHQSEIEDVVHMGLVGMPVVVCVMWVAAGFISGPVH